MKILITGASGFVGSNVSSELKKSNDLQIVDHLGRNDVNLLNADLVSNLFSAVEPDIIINCAALVGSLNYVSASPADVIVQNAQLILNQYNAVLGLKSPPIIVNPVANCAYPASSNLMEEHSLFCGDLHNSVRAYGSTRRFMVDVSDSFFRQHGIKSINFLVPNMYGPGDSVDPNKAHALNALCSRFTYALLSKNEAIKVWGTGAPVREWLYVKDFARLIALALSSKKYKQINLPLNIGQNTGYSIKYIVDLLSEEFFNNQINVEWDNNMPDGAPTKIMDDRQFRKLFSEFNFTSLKDGIRATINYYQKRFEVGQ